MVGIGYLFFETRHYLVIYPHRYEYLRLVMEPLEEVRPNLWDHLVLGSSNLILNFSRGPRGNLLSGYATGLTSLLMCNLSSESFKVYPNP